MMWLKNELESYCKEAVTIQKPKLKHGDYSTNILFTYKGDVSQLKQHLLSHRLIESLEVTQGYLNVFLTTELLIYKGVLSKKDDRIWMLKNRLFEEGYLEGQVSEEWYPLVKKVNELNDSLESQLVDEVLKLFHTLDKGYIYREQSQVVLGGIHTLLTMLMIGIGRAENEDHL